MIKRNNRREHKKLIFISVLVIITLVVCGITIFRGAKNSCVSSASSNEKNEDNQNVLASTKNDTSNKDINTNFKELNSNTENDNSIKDSNKESNNNSDKTSKKTIENLSNQNEVIDYINNDVYDVSFDLNKKVAKIDNEEINMTDLLKVDEQELNEIIENGFDEFVDKNLLGDVKKGSNEVSISNPYSSNKLIVEVKDKSILDKDEKIVSSKQIMDDIYVINYENAQNTKNGYNDLKNNKDVSKVNKNIRFKAFDLKNNDNNVTNSNIKSQSIPSNKMAWGVESAGINHYVEYLNYKNISDTVRVAVLDSGIRASHEAFTDSNGQSRLDMTYSYDFYNSDDDPTDDNGHGTRAAGVVAQSTPSNVKIVPVKILNEEGETDLDTLIEALSYIYSKVDIINLSLGFLQSEYPDIDVSTCESVLSNIYESGNIVVCASGNNYSHEVSYPASSRYTLAAGSVDKNNLKSSFSNYGPEVDFTLPGENLTLPSFESNNAYAYKQSGTSFSSPFLASCIALIKTENHDFERTQIIEILKSNAKDLGDQGKDDSYGYGSIDFDFNMFKKPVIAKYTVSEKWGLSNTLDVCSVASNNIVCYCVTSKNQEPDRLDWKQLTNNAENLEFNTQLENNGFFYLWIKDEYGNVSASQRVQVSHVDKTSPTIIKALSYSNVLQTEFEIQITVQDVQAGLGKIEWYIKSEEDSNYKCLTTNISTDKTITSRVQKNYAFRNLQSDTKYSVYAKVIDSLGNYSVTDTIEVTTVKANSNNENNNNNNNNSNNENGNNSNNNNSTNNSNTNGTSNINNAGTNTNNTTNQSNNNTSTINNNVNTNNTNNNKNTSNSSTTTNTSTIAVNNSTGTTSTSTSNNSKTKIKQIVPNGIYIIKTVLKQSKVLDINGASMDNGANLQIYENLNSNAQKFVITYLGDGYYKIENLKSQKVLSVANSNKKNKANVCQYESNNTDAQKWKIEKTSDGKYKFIAKCNGFALEIAGGKKKDKTNVIVYKNKNNKKAQKFTLKKVEQLPGKTIKNGFYTIRYSKSNKKVLDIDNASKRNGANVQLYYTNGSDAQKFYIKYLNNGFYKIINVNSGKALEVENIDAKKSTNVRQGKWNSSANQQWIIKKTSDGYYNIISRCNNLYLDVAGGKTKNGTNIQVYKKNSSKSQKYKIKVAK